MCKPLKSREDVKAFIEEYLSKNAGKTPGEIEHAIATTDRSYVLRVAAALRSLLDDGKLDYYKEKGVVKYRLKKEKPGEEYSIGELEWGLFFKNMDRKRNATG